MGIAAVLATAAGCPATRHGTGASAAPITLEIGRDGGAIRGVAADLQMTFAAIAVSSKSAIEARDGARLAWSVALPGRAGVMARTADVLVATLADPSAIVALDRATGKQVWRRDIAATEYVVIAAIAGAPDGVVIGGSFGGTLRIGERVVSSAGKSDGFVARLDGHGGVTWLVRVGGTYADAVQGVAASATRFAIAGTFSATAELAGQPLAASDPHGVTADGFVAVLDADGHTAWLTSFGGKADDAIAGVAFDGTGRIGVAGTARGAIRVANTEVAAQGLADAYVAWWSTDGGPGGAVRLGGADFDGASGIVGLANGFAVGGFFSGKVLFDHTELTAGGGDDAFVAVVDPTTAEASHVYQVGGDGREEVAALGPAPGGFVAGLAHTAALRFDGATLPAPKDPMAGAAIVVRRAVTR